MIKETSKHRAFSLIELSIVILIVGIIIAGITSSSSLVRKMRVSTARSLTQSSPVAGIKGLNLWLDTVSEASFIDSQEVNNALIDRWNNLSPQTTSNTFLTSAGADRPVYIEQCINNLPCLRPSTETQKLTISNTNFSRTQTLTIFAVVDSGTNLTTNENAIVKTPSWSSNESFTLKRIESRFDYQLPVGADSDTPQIYENTDYIITVVDEFTSSVAYLNGVAGAPFNYPETDRSFKNLNELVVLENCSGISLSELIIFDRNLTTEERVSVQNYLAKKWGIKIS